MRAAGRVYRPRRASGRTTLIVDTGELALRIVLLYRSQAAKVRVVEENDPAIPLIVVTLKRDRQPTSQCWRLPASTKSIPVFRSKARRSSGFSDGDNQQSLCSGHVTGREAVNTV